jgi:hypothetical protein
MIATAEPQILFSRSGVRELSHCCSLPGCPTVSASIEAGRTRRREGATLGQSNDVPRVITSRAG